MRNKKILFATLSLLIVLITVIAVSASVETSGGGLRILKQDDSAYTLEDSVAIDYPAATYVAAKKFEQIPQTLEAWVFLPSTLGNTAAGPIFGNYRSNTSYGEAFINYEIDEKRHPRIWWGDEFAYNHYNIVFENTTVPQNTWCHITFVYDNLTGVVGCYLNGNLSEQKYYYPSLDGGITDFPFVLGGDQRTANMEYFKGGAQGHFCIFHGA